jgi:hypothetical protein
MTVVRSPLRSESGFVSPNFLVSDQGNLTAFNLSLSGDISLAGDLTTDSNLNVTGNIISNSITINGVSLVVNVDDGIELNKEIKQSGLEKLGVLEILDVRGDVIIEGEDSSEVLTIRDGIVLITSQETGSLDNINIGLTTPAEAAFTEIEVDDVKINNTPTELFHATRKDYVDTTAAALAIALGA